MERGSANVAIAFELNDINKVIQHGYFDGTLLIYSTV